MLPDRREKTFNGFQSEVFNNDVFDPRITVLFHLGAAMAVGCYP